VVLVAVFMGILSSAGGTGLSAATLTLIVVGGVLVGLVFLAFTSLLHVPVVVFFQSYALAFFGSRYEPLRAMMYPQPPPEAPPMSMGPSSQPAM